MKANQFQGLAMVLLLLMAGCDGWVSGYHPEAAQLRIQATGPQVGDRVEAIQDLIVYSQANTGSLVLGTQPDGAQGLMENGPKTSGGIQWARVNFDSGADGLVLYSMIGPVGGGEDPPPPTGDIVLGMFGCSQTRDVLKGFDLAYPEIPHWPQETPSGVKIAKRFSGKTLMNWGDPDWGGYNQAWGAFEDALDYMPGTNLIIFEPCMSAMDREDVPTLTPAEVAAAQYVAGQVAARAPGVAFYVVGMNDWTPATHVCPLTGDYGPESSAAVADTMAALTFAKRADFILGPLAFPEEVVPDGCHATADGMTKQAAQVVAWMNTLN